jgi:hypothetical protein
VVERWVSHDHPDLIINLGDVLEDVSPEIDRANYGRFLDLLAAAGVPTLHVAGNHDQAHLDPDELFGLWQMPESCVRHPGSTAYAVSHGGLRFIARSTRWAPPAGVFLGAGELGFLRRELSRAREPVIVLTHQGLSDAVLEGNHWFESAPETCLIHERAEIRSEIERSGKVIAAFNGHAHWNHLEVVRGIPYLTLQSLTENVTRDGPEPTPAAAYAVVDVDGDGARVHVRVEGAQPARYQFSR